jgi:hypothetical protein
VKDLEDKVSQVSKCSKAAQEHYKSYAHDRKEKWNTTLETMCAMVLIHMNSISDESGE